MTFLVVAVGAAIGACLRFLTDRQVKAWQYTQFPWGTFVVNAVGSLVLGFLTGAALFGFDAPLVHALLGTGLCGALTTFSQLRDRAPVHRRRTAAVGLERGGYALLRNRCGRDRHGACRRGVDGVAAICLRVCSFVVEGLTGPDSGKPRQ